MRPSSYGGDELGAVEPTAQTRPEMDLCSSSFDPGQYLAVTHACTTFSGLQNELKQLKRTMSDKTEQLKALVSAHFDQYLSCHEAVRSLGDDIRSHNNESEQLANEMKTLKETTDSTLSVMLQRAKEQRRIRNTLNVLTRFRPVFEIVSKMHASMLTKDFEKLADDYCRIKYLSSKSNVLVLKQVFAAAQEIAQGANDELLAYFNDTSLSIRDQKRAITVLNALGFVEKPTLTCLTKQFEFLDRKLASLAQQNDASTVVSECSSVIYRFRSGLWGFICDVFQSPSTNKLGKDITSAEAEAIQQQAWRILSTSAQLIESRASPPTASLLTQLNESFRELNTLKKCANATSLNTNIAQLKESFCDRFRVKIVLEFLQQVCKTSQDQLMQTYFEPVVGNLPSSEPSTDLLVGSDPSSDGTGSDTIPRTKVAQVIMEAREVCNEFRNTSMISSESKIHLNRATVLTSCSNDVLRCWESIWRSVGQMLLEMLDVENQQSDKSSSSKKAKATGDFREVVAKTFKQELYNMLSMFLQALMNSFTAEITAPSTLASVTGSVRDRDGADVCILFAVVSNCINLRDEVLPNADQWLGMILGDPRLVNDHTNELRQLVLDVEAKCISTYVTMHSNPLLQVLRAGAAEEAQLVRVPIVNPPSAGASSRTNSRSQLIVGLEFPISPTNGSSSKLAMSSIPTDGRQYVFNVLLQLITLRSEAETSLGHVPQCAEYVHRVSFQLTHLLGEFLEDAVRDLDSPANSKSSEITEWLCIHLLVEVRFFQYALADLLSENTKIRLVALEKALERVKTSDKAAMAHVTLLKQMKLQTRLYLLALQP